MLCGRLPRDGVQEHHLVPRTCHSNKWFRKNFSRGRMRETISVCRHCHSAIHRFVPNEKELGRHYNTVESLMEQPDIRRFVEWAKDRR